jgi:DNA-binding NtrC family response regulator
MSGPPSGPKRGGIPLTDEPVTVSLGLGEGDGRPTVTTLVRVIGATARPETYRLEAGHCRIGSGGGCDVVVDHPTVSRAHVELGAVREGIVVRDLGSRNGTFYLGQRIEKVVLAHGARIQIGAVTIAIDADQEEQLPPYLGDSYRGVVGASPSMQRVFAMMTRLESALATVLVEGESGVGKDVIARAIHEGSSVRTGPLVTLNCGALPRELVASELFGHKKGAFTGASETRKGAFESADGGTLFLDEIGELPIEVQPMLLRAIEAGEVRAVGGDSDRRVRVRVIAATHRDLELECREGRFREDLFYRLAVVRLRVPPLRERIADIEPLARLFGREAGLDDLPASVLEQLKSRQWSGNARELRNAVQAYAALGVLTPPTRSKSATLDFAFRQLVDPKRAYAEQKDDVVERFTAIYVSEVLAQTGGNQTAAAKIAGMDRGYFGRLVAKYGARRA